MDAEIKGDVAQKRREAKLIKRHMFFFAHLDRPDIGIVYQRCVIEDPC